MLRRLAMNFAAMSNCLFHATTMNTSLRFEYLMRWVDDFNGHVIDLGPQRFFEQESACNILKCLMRRASGGGGHEV